jgi:hypothetical protein
MGKNQTSNGAGMTIEEARALIKSGYAWIRHRGKEDKTHWGGGVLLDVEGDNAIIKPGLRHRKTEKVPLADIKPWKSKNAGRMQRDGVVLRDEEEQMKYVIVNKEDSLVWAGSQMGFLDTMSHATTYESKSAANMGIGGMKRSKRWADIGQSNKIDIVPLEQAEAMMEAARPSLPFKPDVQIEEKPVVTDQAPTKTETKTTKTEALREFHSAMQDLEEARALVLEAKERVDRAIEGLSAEAAEKTKEAMALA